MTGLAADTRARPLREDGSVIDGLWVAGNDHTSIMGGHYPAGGINLCPALTFEYLAGLDAAGHR